MSMYQGMRWLKCDLQVQTPADAPNWRGKPMEQSEAGANKAAESYIRRCYELGSRCQSRLSKRSVRHS